MQAGMPLQGVTNRWCEGESSSNGGDDDVYCCCDRHRHLVPLSVPQLWAMEYPARSAVVQTAMVKPLHCLLREVLLVTVKSSLRSLTMVKYWE
jgi:hypothetical protein